LTPPTVESALGAHPTDVVAATTIKQTAAVLTAFHRAAVGPKPDVVFPVSLAIHRYQYNGFDSEAKPSMVAFMSPFLHEAFSPDRSRGNEQRGVDKRIVAVKNDTPVTPLLHKMMADFLTGLIPVPHSLHPTDVDAVYDHMDRPAQRRLLTDSETLVSHFIRIIKAFVKVEAYAKPGDPRLISTINPVDKRDYSRYMYPFSKLLAQQPWYAFSRAPNAIAAKVADVCSDAVNVTKTDFSRLDGTIAPVLRELERQTLLRAFHPSHANALIDLHGSQYNLRAVTTMGVRYETGTARASGSPETSAFNSIDNAFCCYLALRMTKRNGAFLDHAEAWAELLRNLFGGDDGLVRNLPKENLERAATMLGLTIKAEPVARGSFGVMFLARVYSPNVWFGDSNSCCDLQRQLSKFHVTSVLPSNVTAWQKLVQKARSFNDSDSNTPIIGPFCRKVVAMSQGVVLDPEQIHTESYNSRFPTDVQYPNEPADWMVAYAADLDLDGARFNYWLQRATVQRDFLAPPLLTAPRPLNLPSDAVVVVDDVVYRPPPPSVPAISVEQPRVNVLQSNSRHQRRAQRAANHNRPSRVPGPVGHRRAQQGAPPLNPT